MQQKPRGAGSVVCLSSLCLFELFFWALLSFFDVFCCLVEPLLYDF